MIPGINEFHVALAAAPVATVLMLREFWTRRRNEADLLAREERARLLRQEAMRAMRQALDDAEAAKRSREEFLSRMSHELRTPLNAVIGFSRTLEKNRAGNQRPQDLQLLGRVRAGGEQLLRLVEDVLDQASIERGQLALALDETDVAAVAARAVDAYRAAAAAKGLRLIGVFPERAPTMQLDARRFEQVLQHLVDNAVKFTPSGIVRVTLVTHAASWKPARILVSDTGIGIPAGRLESIFEPFQQVESSTGRGYGGTGLGLPLAKQLCAAMDCRLSVESEMGVGSRFTIRFPERIQLPVRQTAEPRDLAS